VPISIAQMTERFRDIHVTRMQGLLFINSKLRVEAVGFRPWEEHELGVLITPWFMNLIVLPEVDADIDQGHKIDAGFPSGNIELTAAQDEELGLYFSAVLFSSVMDIPNQETARDIAAEVMRELFDTKHNSKVISRRSILTATSNADA
jgi:[NiFe] hydrogenase assembly HybE family chaperone